MARDLQIRLACAAALLVTGLAGLYIGARLGVVQLEAGEMTLVFGGGDQGLTMGVASRGCPPHCNINIDWRPTAQLSATGL
ncbi:MAG: hypothetical protein EON61_19460 [Alphaproteobacteria bacterium]|nr:MAG: hypothetical protein EON61_19460 [Alphaproteobacteria bacterium]